MKRSNPLKGHWTTKKHLFFLVFIFVPLFFSVYLVKIHPTHKPTGDAQYYLTAAYNLYQYNIFSGQRGEGIPTPEAYRPPAYPWFLAQLMHAIPVFEDVDTSWFQKQGNELAHEFVYLKYVQILLLLVIALLVAFTVWDMTGKLCYAQWALWILAFHPVLHRYVQRFYSELFGIFLITCFSALFYRAMKKRSAILLGLSGVMLGATTLTFPQWSYVMPFVVGALILFGILERKSRYRLLTGALLLLIAFQCVIQPWKIRNEEVLGRNYISGRGGAILLLRSYYDQMSLETYLGSFLYWTYGLPKYLLKKYADPQCYSYLVHEHAGSAIDLTRMEKIELLEKYGDDRPDFDKLLMKISINRIFEHPIKHILVSIPIGYRSLQDPTFSVFNLVVFFFFFYAFGKALFRKKYEICCLLVPAIALVCFNALVTHGLPRYTWQVIPIVWIGAFAGFSMWREKRATIRRDNGCTR